MKIAFIALWSPSDPRYWSGTPYFSYNAIREAIPDVVLIDTARTDWVLFYLGKLSRRMGIDLLREPFVLWIYKTLVDRQLTRHRPDVVISVGASHKLQGTAAGCHIIHVADALFATIVEAYDHLAGLSPRTIAFGNAVQTRFLKKVDYLCLSSDWAVRSAQLHYSLSRCRTRVLPLGANFASDPGFEPSSRYSHRNLSFLFIGGDWQRKGGPLLVQAFTMIQQRFADATLHIVGCTPEIDPTVPSVTLHGFLRKSDPKDAETLDKLLRTASFLFVPSRQEAFGIVFCEACAYGLPSITTDTGGVGTIIINGENGLLLAPEDEAEDYARKIVELWQSRETYEDMCRKARMHFETRLNWTAWARGIVEELEQLRAAEAE